MNDMKKALEEIFNLASSIPVSGQYVDVMASVRGKLRSAYKMAETLENKGKEAPTNG